MPSLYINLTQAAKKLRDSLQKVIDENRATEKTEISIAKSISSECGTFTAREIIIAKNKLVAEELKQKKKLVAEEKKQKKNWTKVTRGFLGKEGKLNFVDKQIEKGLVNGDSY